MDCKKFREDMSIYIDGLLTGSKKEKFEEHLKKCEECSREFNELKQLIEDVNNLEEIPLPENYHTELMEMIDKEKENVKALPALPAKRNKVKINFKQYTSVAAGIVITLFAVSVLGSVIGNIGARTNDMAQNVEAAGAETGMARSLDIPEPMMEQYSMTADAVQAPVGAAEYNPSQQISRKIVNIEIEVSDLSEAINIISSLNGYSTLSEVHYRTDDESKKYGWADFTYRVNENELEFTRNVLRSLGEVNRENESMEIFTDEYENNRIYAKNAQSEFDRLMIMLKETRNLDVLVYIENRISEVEYSLDRYMGRMREIEAFTQEPYINISVVSNKEQKAAYFYEDMSFGQRISNAFSKSVSGTVGFFENVSIFAAVIFIPVLAICIVVFVVYSIIKKIGGRRR